MYTCFTDSAWRFRVVRMVLALNKYGLEGAQKRMPQILQY